MARKKKVELTDEQKVQNILDGGETEAYLNGERTFVTQDISVEPVEITTETLKKIETIDSTGFKENFDRMYQITDKIVEKILAKSETLKQDSYVVREEFGEALAAGYRYLRYQGEISKQIRDAHHSEDAPVDYEADMYKEFADVFMMTTSFCRHNNFTMENKPFIIYRPINMTLEEYLTKVSEVLSRINYHFNSESVNADYMYEFLEETFAMISKSSVEVLSKKIDKLYNKIFNIID